MNYNEIRQNTITIQSKAMCNIFYKYIGCYQFWCLSCSLHSIISSLWN